MRRISGGDGKFDLAHCALLVAGKTAKRGIVPLEKRIGALFAEPSQNRNRTFQQALCGLFPATVLGNEATIAGEQSYHEDFLAGEGKARTVVYEAVLMSESFDDFPGATAWLPGFVEMSLRQ